MNAVADVIKYRSVLSEVTGSGQANRQLDLEYDHETQALWAYMKPAGAPCVNLGMLGEIRETDRAVERCKGMLQYQGDVLPVKFHIAASRCHKIFNYGGDLAHFIMLIRSRNVEALRYYATQCIDALYSRIRSYESQAITIALIQGEALGGGFESALASHVIIAEEGSRMGCPEILFNLFPGMGAYSLLSRRIGRRKAEEIITSGKLYSARELHEVGLVDIVAPEGGGKMRSITILSRTSAGRMACAPFWNAATRPSPSPTLNSSTSSISG